MKTIALTIIGSYLSLFYLQYGGTTSLYLPLSTPNLFNFCLLVYYIHSFVKYMRHIYLDNIYSSTIIEYIIDSILFYQFLFDHNNKTVTNLLLYIFVKNYSTFSGLFLTKKQNNLIERIAKLTFIPMLLAKIAVNTNNYFLDLAVCLYILTCHRLIL